MASQLCKQFMSDVVGNLQDEYAEQKMLRLKKDSTPHLQRLCDTV